MCVAGSVVEGDGYQLMVSRSARAAWGGCTAVVDTVLGLVHTRPSPGGITLGVNKTCGGWYVDVKENTEERWRPHDHLAASDTLRVCSFYIYIEQMLLSKAASLQRLMHTRIHRRRSQPCRATASSSGAVRARRLVQWHFDTQQLGGAWD